MFSSIRFSTIIFLIVISCFLSSADDINSVNNLKLSIKSPSNRSICGTNVEIRMKVDFLNDKNLFLNPVGPELKLCISMKHMKLPPVCPFPFNPMNALSYGPLAPGENHIEISIEIMNFQNTSNTLKSFDSVIILNTGSLEGKEFKELHFLEIYDELFHSLQPLLKPLLNSVAFSFDDAIPNIYQKALIVSPQTLDFFDWSEYSSSKQLSPLSCPKDFSFEKRDNEEDCSKFLCCIVKPLNKFAVANMRWYKLFQNHSCIDDASKESIDSRPSYQAFYDASVLSFASKKMFEQPQKELVKHVESLFSRTLSHLVIITRSTLEIEVLFNKSTFLSKISPEQQITFGNSFNDTRVVSVFLRPSIRLLEVRQKSYFAGKQEQEINKLNIHSNKARDISTIEFETTKVGLDFLRLKNACIKDLGEVVMLKIQDNQAIDVDTSVEGPLEIDAILDQEKKSTTFGDSSFKFSPFLPFLELTIQNNASINDFYAYESVLNEMMQAKNKSVRWMNHSAGIVRPFFDFHVFHHMQSLAGLIAGATSFLDDNNANGVNWEWIENLRLLLLPDYQSMNETQYEWSNSFLSLVTKAFDAHPNRLNKLLTVLTENQLSSWVLDGSSDSLSEKRVKNMDKLYSKEVFRGIDSSDIGNLICFPEIVIFGQANDKMGFFVSSKSQQEFQKHSFNSLSPFERENCTTDQNSSEINKKIKVSIVLRLHNRRIRNLDAIQEILLENDAIDKEWLMSSERGILSLESLSFEEQISLMKEIDILIAVHGAAFINAALFMTPHSTCIALMQSRHIEFVLPQVIQQANVQFHFLPILNPTRSSNCKFPSHCIPSNFRNISHIEEKEDKRVPLSRASAADCLGIRNCDLMVDIDWLEVLVQQSIYHVQANKWI